MTRPGEKSAALSARSVPSLPSSAPKQEHLALADLDSTGSAHVRLEIAADTVADYADLLKEGREFPPITVFRSAGKLYLADGFHRVAAHLAAGRTHIEANVHEGGAHDALWFELGANAQHGRRLGRAETRRAVGLALDRTPDVSSKLIADHVGCSSGLVVKVRQERVRDAGGSDGAHEPVGGVGVTQQRDPAAERRQTDQVDSEDRVQSVAGRSRDQHDDSEDDARPSFGKPSSRQSVAQSTRILSKLAQDAAHFGDQTHMIDFRDLDPEEVLGWIVDLKKGRAEIAKLIQRLGPEARDV